MYEKKKKTLYFEKKNDEKENSIILTIPIPITTPPSDLVRSEPFAALSVIIVAPFVVLPAIFHLQKLNREVGRCKFMMLMLVSSFHVFFFCSEM
jgi:hypothetical protein